MYKTKVCLASVYQRRNLFVNDDNFKDPLYILGSYWEMKQDTKYVAEFLERFKTAEHYVFDSGAFSFQNAKNKGLPKFENFSYEEYALNYANFVKKHNIKNWVELDIDTVIGHDSVLELRSMLEETIGEKCMPVWHENRGENGWADMVDKYDYIGMGGITDKKIRLRLYPEIVRMCEYAHSKGVKVHGFGYTQIDQLNERAVPFDTVDSRSWLGVQGQWYKMREDGTLYYEKAPKGTHWKPITINNYLVWKEFGKRCYDV